MTFREAFWFNFGVALALFVPLSVLGAFCYVVAHFLTKFW